jgi:heavy metal translocating P-type ATPase
MEDLPSSTQQTRGTLSSALMRPNMQIAMVALIGAILTLLLRYAIRLSLPWSEIPSLVVIVGGGGTLVYRLLRRLGSGEFGADWLAGIAIVSSLFLQEYLAGALVVLMLSGGEAVEEYAMGRASSVLDALAKRMPSIAHRRDGATMADIKATEVRIGDLLVVLPHELCPVDGEVTDGHSSMDESFLTGEPYRLAKTPGCKVISGAINGEGVITIRAEKEAQNSRYLQIMAVMDSSKQRRPRIRRIGDILGALYTPVAVSIAVGAWIVTGDPLRFLSVLVVATPCPLLIGIPVAIIGAVSWCARNGIVVKDPAALERAQTCTTLITDKTGTLTLGEAVLSSVWTHGTDDLEVLRLAATVERYSKHPLAQSIIEAATERKIVLGEASEVQEVPGQGLVGMVQNSKVTITGRKGLSADLASQLPTAELGLECIVLVNDQLAAVLRFRDEPRSNSKHFVEHLGPSHSFNEVILLSGDREEEVRDVANQLGIKKIFFSKTPEQKVEIVRQETVKARTMYLGDGINDAPALLAATVGVAFGPRSDITSEAAGVVVMEPSLRKVDQFLHISRHMRAVLLQSAVGGMAFSIVGMGFAAYGVLNPVWGAILQQVIDLLAVLNALRVATLSDKAAHL